MDKIEQINTAYQCVCEWLLGNDTGSSSKSIVAYMLGIKSRNFDAPYDPAGIGRCFRLLEIFPEWENRMPEMAYTTKDWALIIQHWESIHKMMDNEVGIDWSKGKNARRTFDLRMEIRRRT